MTDATKVYNNEQFWINDFSVLYKDGNYLKFIPKTSMKRPEQLNAITRLSIFLLILSIVLQLYDITKIAIAAIIFFVVIYFIFDYNEKETFRAKYDVDSINDDIDMNNENIDKKKRYEKKTIIKSGYYDSDNNLKIDKYLSTIPKSKKVKFSLDDDVQYERAICKKPSTNNPFMNKLLKDITTYPELSPSPCNADDDQIEEKINECFNEDLYRDVDDLFNRRNSQREFYTVPHSNPNDQKSFAEWCYKKDDICKIDQSKCLKYEDLRYKNKTL